MAHDNSGAPVEQAAGARPTIRRPWLAPLRRARHRVRRHRVDVGQPPGVGYAIVASVAAVIWVALDTCGIHPSASGLILIACWPYSTA